MADDDDDETKTRLVELHLLSCCTLSLLLCAAARAENPQHGSQPEPDAAFPAIPCDRKAELLLYLLKSFIPPYSRVAVVAR